MTIKSDKWIRRMSQEHEMIVPFEPNQVRHVDGEKVISFGTSSYGYDIRCADEFKVFTNINSTIVDPKNFDPDSFVEVSGKGYCIIPPNSFALARTVEKLKIPRDVLTVCLGKSTYARCFTGDTKVALVNGTTLTFDEMSKRAETGERFWGYSVNVDGEVVVSELISPRKIGKDKVLAITLDNGQVIKATADHKFMIRDGSYVEAKDLKPEMSLMPLYRGEYRGYESVYQPTIGRMISTHWLADHWNIVNGIYDQATEQHRHHIDHNRRNNNPTNITRMPGDEHLSLHNEEKKNWTEEQRAEHGTKIARAIEQRQDDIEWSMQYRQKQADRAYRFWNDAQYADARARVLIARLDVTEEQRDQRRQAMVQKYSNPEERALQSERMKKAWEGADNRREKQRGIAKLINLRDEITDVIVAAALKAAGTIRGAARSLGCDRSVFRRFPEVLSSFYGTKVANNHKVVSVTEVEGEHDVYCLTVPTHGNFALESGVFVKNCGIIVNVTPFEPEWEGYVTLEFSNTTPLPAKIYANEGVAQVLFFQSDEVCDVSYADRGGKYQNQPAEVVVSKT